MTHLSEEEVAAASRGSLPAVAGAHLAGCARCETRVAAWSTLAKAASKADLELTGAVTVPSFGTLLGPVLTAERTPVEAAAPSLSRSFRLTVTLVLGQAKLLPRSLGPLTVLGFTATIGIALGVPEPAWGRSLFGAMTTLLILLGAVSTSSARTDPRRQLMLSLPISPAVVFAARLVLVLAVDLIGALVCSALVAALGQPSGLGVLVASWLGPSLLSASVAVVVAVWRSSLLGTLCGALTWFVGSAVTTPRPSAPTGGPALLVSRIWATSPWTIAAALVLLAVAVWLMSVRRNSSEPIDG
jgi:Na+-transporting methylmalonyl-CoA/oxaloacetate decarboxylase gamma subunit